MTRLYISGPMTGYENYNFKAFDFVAMQLVEAGFEVENPADKGIVDGWTWADYLKYDIRAITMCDGIALLPGWAESRGARLEITVADGLGMTSKPWRLWVCPIQGLI